MPRNLTSTALQQLVAIRLQLEQIEPLPWPGSPEAMGDHENWMTRNREIMEKVREAERYALMTVPEPIEQALELIREQERRILRMCEESEGTKS
jgi:hypothetical protein